MSCRASRRCRRDPERLLIDRWDIVGLLRDLTARDQHPGVIAFAEDGAAIWDSGTLADKALRLTRGLQDAGVGRGSRVALSSLHERRLQLPRSKPAGRRAA